MQRLESKMASVLGHKPSPRAVRCMLLASKWVDLAHERWPDVPIEQLWDEVEKRIRGTKTEQGGG